MAFSVRIRSNSYWACACPGVSVTSTTCPWLSTATNLPWAVKFLAWLSRSTLRKTWATESTKALGPDTFTWLGTILRDLRATSLGNLPLGLISTGISFSKYSSTTTVISSGFISTTVTPAGGVKVTFTLLDPGVTPDRSRLALRNSGRKVTIVSLGPRRVIRTCLGTPSTTYWGLRFCCCTAIV